MIKQRILALLMSAIMIPTGLGQSISSIFGSRVFEVSVDENTKAVLDVIKDNSYLDIEKIVTNLPDVNNPSRVINTVFNIDTKQLRNKMYTLRDKYYTEGDKLKGDICNFIGAYGSTFEDCEICLREGDDGTSEFVLTVHYLDGSSEDLYTGFIYYPETGEFKDRNGTGIVGLGFDFDFKNMVIYAVLNCWMRDFGFCFGYDLFCYTTPFFDYTTRRFKFDYDGKEWMIQAWKGRYVVTNGAEVGIYNRNKLMAGSYYDCASDEDMLKMSLSVYHDDELLFTRVEQDHWWINGFQLSKNLYEPNELTIKFTIEMKDKQMLDAFCKSVSRNIYRDVTYKTDGLKVYLEW